MRGRAPDGTSYDVVGKDHRRAVVLVHGLGLNRHSWQWQTGALGEHYRVITYDLYGHGDSAAPPETPSLSLFSRQLRNLLDHLRMDTAAVGGFSLGGMIARRFAMDFPARLWALAVLHSAHQRSTEAHEAIAARVRQARSDGPAATADAALVRWFGDGFRERNPEMMALVRGWVIANRKDIYADIYEVLVDGVTELVGPSPPISTPTLVMTGEDDHGNSPEMARAIAAEIVGSRLVVLPQLRHMALAEAPELFNAELLSFLAAVEIGATRPD